MAVSFKEVTKRFADGTVALDRLDLDFELGEFIVLLGPSGSGKTTACRLLAGLEIADRAAASRSTARTSPTCRRASAASAWCSRTTRSTATRRVFENIAYPLRIRKLPAAEIDR